VFQRGKAVANTLSEDDFSKLLSTLEVAYQRSLIRRWGVRSSVWSPPTDVYEAGDRLIVCAEIAGMRDGEFHITVDERFLVINGVRPRAYGHPQPALHQLEIRHGEFHIEVMLPWPIDRSGVEASYRDGFLQIELPRHRSQSVNVINVHVEEDVDS
jgi:HSP20 family protein